MTWTLPTTAAIVLALASTMATHATNAADHRDTPEWERYWGHLGKVYRRLKPKEIRYGTEVGPSRYIGEIDPPFVTPDPDQVEVVAFVTYGQRAWIINYPVMHRWKKTLPDNVSVQFLPQKNLRQGKIHPRTQPLRAVRQNLYQTALHMGVTSRKAHALIARMVTGNTWTLENPKSQRRYARKLRLDPEQFQALRTHPAVRWEGQVADWLEIAQADERWRLAKEVAYNPRETIEHHFPELMINGRWIVSMTATHDVRRTYRMANWAIRQELENLRENSGWPRNAEQFAAWLAPRDKQILSRRVNGTPTEDFPAGIVYEADKQAIWLLNAYGRKQAIAKLTHTDDGSTHFVYEKNGQTEYFDIWRVTRQLMPWIRHDGTPQHYGAFLPEDPLVREKDVNKQRKGVKLETDTGTWKVHLNANGKATVVLGPGNVVVGEWTINNGYVELTTQDGQTQRWAQASTRAERWAQGPSGTDTFNVPPESIRPWDFTELFARTQTTPTPPAPTAAQMKNTPKPDARTQSIKRALRAAKEAIDRLQNSYDQR